MKEVKKFETIDGLVFDTVDEAKEWEAKVYKAASAIVRAKEYFEANVYKTWKSYDSFISELNHPRTKLKLER